MKLDTLKTIMRAFNTASDDMTRFNICCVLLEPGKERREVIVTATNGHALSSVVCPDEELCEAMGGQSFLVEPDDLPGLKLLAKDAKTVQLIPVVFADAGTKRTLTLGAYSIKVTLKAERAQDFPDYRSIIPKMPEEPIEVSFDAGLLVDLAKALDAGLSKSGKLVLKMTMKDKLSPLIITMQGNQGVIMPCRL